MVARKQELDLCSRGCQPELLVVLQLTAATLFSSATSRCRTPHTSYLERRCLVLAALLGKVTGLGGDPPVIRACHSFLELDYQ